MAILRRDETTACFHAPTIFGRISDNRAKCRSDNHRRRMPFSASTTIAAAFDRPGRPRIPNREMSHSISVGTHKQTTTTFSTPAGIVRRHRCTGRSPTPPRRKEQKTQPEKQGASNDVRPPEYRVAGPLGHEIVSRSQKHFTDRRIGNPKRNPPRKQGRSR